MLLAKLRELLRLKGDLFGLFASVLRPQGLGLFIELPHDLSHQDLGFRFRPRCLLDYCIGSLGRGILVSNENVSQARAAHVGPSLLLLLGWALLLGIFCTHFVRHPKVSTLQEPHLDGRTLRRRRSSLYRLGHHLTDRSSRLVWKRNCDLDQLVFGHNLCDRLAVKEEELLLICPRQLRRLNLRDAAEDRHPTGCLFPSYITHGSGDHRKATVCCPDLAARAVADHSDASSLQSRPFFGEVRPALGSAHGPHLAIHLEKEAIAEP
mmetsp:Transcript_47679/g.111632  ORF Transcript_47679/g.111632 Transcript_47679/m.111632 type:complete len:265 (-) Transcript_47679:623-1417(-)